MNVETIKCKNCGTEVRKRSINHVLCMKCVMEEHQRNIKKLYALDMRNMGVLDSKHMYEKHKEETKEY